MQAKNWSIVILDLLPPSHRRPVAYRPQGRRPGAPAHTRATIGATHPHHLQTPQFQPLTHPHNYPYYKNISAPWQARPYKKCNTHPNIQKTLPA